MMLAASGVNTGRAGRQSEPSRPPSPAPPGASTGQNPDVSDWEGPDGQIASSTGGNQPLRPTPTPVTAFDVGAEELGRVFPMVAYQPAFFFCRRWRWSTTWRSSNGADWQEHRPRCRGAAFVAHGGVQPPLHGSRGSYRAGRRISPWERSAAHGTRIPPFRRRRTLGALLGRTAAGSTAL